MQLKKDRTLFTAVQLNGLSGMVCRLAKHGSHKGHGYSVRDPDRMPQDKMSPDKMPQDKMSPGQNATGQNVTRRKCHRTKCHPDKMPQDKMSHGQNVTGHNVPRTKRHILTVEIKRLSSRSLKKITNIKRVMGCESRFCGNVETPIFDVFHNFPRFPRFREQV